MENNITQELLFKYFRGETDKAEVKRILEWVDASEAHRNEYEQAVILFSGLAVYAENAELENRQKHARRTNIRTLVLRTSSIAAALIVAAGLYFIGKDRGEAVNTNLFNTIHVPDGQQMELTLADGSLIKMNSGSTLEYPVVFAKDHRRVKLEGEAFFKVEHDQERPFTVETYASEVSVLGTEFNVRADEEANQFSTSLIDGKVKVSSRYDLKDEVILLPSEKVSMESGRLVKGKMNKSRDLSWTKGIIYLEQMPFEDLMKIFERCFNVQITIEREQMPQLHIVSGKIRISDGVDYALSLLQDISTGFKYHKVGENGIVIR